MENFFAWLEDRESVGEVTGGRVEGGREVGSPPWGGRVERADRGRGRGGRGEGQGVGGGRMGKGGGGSVP